MLFWLRTFMCVFASVALVSVPVQAASLRYRIEGVEEAQRVNMRAYLGESPQTSEDAARFLSRAPTQAKRALESQGFYNASVTVNVDKSVEPWRAVLAVSPGAVLRYTQVDVKVTGEGEADATFVEILDQNVPEVGDPVHHGRYEELKTALQQSARQRGYFDARFERKQIRIGSEDGAAARGAGKAPASQASLVLTFDTGPRYRFGAVTVDDQAMASTVLERLLPFAVGDPYKQSALLELRRRLLRLGYFASALVLPVLDERADGQVPLRVELTTAPRHSYEIGVGYSTDTRQRFSLSWASPRLNNRGHSQETVLRWSPVNPQARVTYSIPLDDPANDVMQFIARLENNEFGDLDSRQREFGVRRERTKGSSVRAMQFRLLNEEWGVFGRDFTADFALAGISRSRRSRRGDAVDPRSGLSQFYSAEVASADLGSDEDLLRLYGSVTGLKRFGTNWRAVVRAELGALYSSSGRPNNLPPSLAFFAGGDRSIRGFAYQSVGRELTPAQFAMEGGELPPPVNRSLVVGGTRLATGSLELQRYFGENWRGALFVDGGDAFVENNFEFNVGVGFGVHYLSPVGALRLELANPVSESGGSWRVHINIGAEF